MEVEIRLFATFKAFLPDGTEGFSFRKTVHEGTTVGTVLNELHLPKEMNKTIIINSIPASSEQTLHEGDVVSIFPPIAGG